MHMLQALFFSGVIAFAQLLTLTASRAEEVPYMTIVFTPAPLQPRTWKEFCEQSPAECAADAVERIEFTSATIAELERVNADVNSRGAKARDDCVWFTLEKRRVLAKLGWPQGALLPTLVRGYRGDHLVLTVVTDQGEYVMDNYVYPHKVNLWSRLIKYRFVSRYHGLHARWAAVVDNRADRLIQ